MSSISRYHTLENEKRQLSKLGIFTALISTGEPPWSDEVDRPQILDAAPHCGSQNPQLGEPQSKQVITAD